MLMKTLISKISEEQAYPVLPENFVKSKLDKEDKTPTQNRAATYTTHVHVSSLAQNFCPRQYAIALKEDLALYESVTGGHKVTWELGRAAEKHVRAGFINQYGLKHIYAQWRCDCKKTVREGFYREISCEECGKPVDIFEEPDIWDDEHGVKGHPDLVFNYRQTLFVMEIKSMNKKDWEALTEPLPTHILQAGMYPRLLRNKGLKVSPVVTFVYVGKEFVWGSPYKEFHVDMSDPKYVKMHDDMLLEAKKIKDYVEKDIPLERICQTINGSMAKKCPVSFRCFYHYDDKI